MVALRTQIIETQKTRSDLMKWKLLLVATLGGVGLGVEKIDINGSHFLLCFIPLICVYVDSLCAHLSLRIRIIGAFIGSQKQTISESNYYIDYEQFLDFLRESQDVPNLEVIALHWSTYVLSFLILLYGIFSLISEFEPLEILFIVAGLAGFIITFFYINRIHRKEEKRIIEEVKK